MQIPRVLLCGFVSAIATGSVLAQPARSTEALPPNNPAETSGFDRSQSAALFVGVRQFTHDENLTEVRYAVDDAVDLAFVFALDRNVHLVDAGRVILALSGDPQKPESRQKLAALRAAGATIRGAGESDILLSLERQARSAGKKGFLIVGIATHGFSAEGVHYLLAANSLFEHRETSISTNKLLDIADRSDAQRSIFFIDACRSRMTSGERSEGERDPRSAAPLAQDLGQTRGEVVFYAAAAGQYAYDDDERKNGVFTAAVIDGLRCAATANARGLVTVEALSDYVDSQVLTWIRKHRQARGGKGIQILGDASSKVMPLAACHRPAAAMPANVRWSERIFNVFDIAGTRLWGGEIDGTIVQAEVADLDGDGVREVIVGGGGSGSDTGKILIFGSGGGLLWSRNTMARAPYGSNPSGRMAITSFATGDLFRDGKREIVSLSIDAQGWYPARLCLFDNTGELRGSYWHPGHLHKVVIGGETASGEPRIIIAGVNNDLQQILPAKGYFPAIMVLDPRRVAGEAPPYFGGSQNGTQLWYGVIGPTGQSIGRLELVDRDQNGTNQISVWMSSANVLYLDFAGNIVGTGKGDGATGDITFGLIEKK
jgi:hypothetical protein